MSSSIRIEVLEQLYTQVKEHGVIPLSRQDRLKAIQKLAATRQKYEEARRDVLLHELASYYRVAIFGSAKLGKDSEEFRFITELARALVEARDVDIVTGGGPGIMEAANLGAQTAVQNARGIRKLRAKSVGITMNSLPASEMPNQHLHFEARHTEFPTRLQTFLDKTDAAYHATGGIGTLCELALLLQTKQVGHIEGHYPIIAHPSWEPVVNAWNNELYHRRLAQDRTPLISSQDLQLILFSDQIPDIVGVVSQSYDNWAQNIRRYVQLLP